VERRIRWFTWTFYGQYRTDDRDGRTDRQVGLQVRCSLHALPPADYTCRPVAPPQTYQLPARLPYHQYRHHLPRRRHSPLPPHHRTRVRYAALSLLAFRTLFLKPF